MDMDDSLFVVRDDAYVVVVSFGLELDQVFLSLSCGLNQFVRECSFHCD
jgi:hypothetical protein